MSPHLVAHGLVPTAVELAGFGGLRGQDPVSRHGRPHDADAWLAEPSPVAGITLEHAATALLEDLAALGDEPALVVAHSLGGVVVAEAAQRAPERFAGIVFVSSMTPVAGLAAGDYNALPEMQDSMLPSLFAADPMLVGAIRIDVDSSAGRARAREAFYDDVPDPVAQRALSMLACDAPLGVAGTVAVTADRFGAVPKSWVLCSRDRILTPALQRRLVSELDAVSAQPTTVVELASSHSPFLSRPQQLAEIIARSAAGLLA